MVTVALSPAYVWDCEECGRENFQRAVSVLLNPNDEVDADVIRALNGLSSGEAIPEGVRAITMTRPNRVTCRHCNTEFLAVDSGEDGEDS